MDINAISYAQLVSPGDIRLLTGLRTRFMAGWVETDVPRGQRQAQWLWVKVRGRDGMKKIIIGREGRS